MRPSNNIYLVGLMGAGKTTIGRLLAKRLNWQFYDSDHEIEARTGVRIPTIFEIEGEPGFRRRELQTITELTDCQQVVMATGGGVVLQAENRQRLREHGFVVYLAVDPPILYERTRLDRNRPLLQVADPLARLRQLHSERDPLYREVADFVVDGNRLNANSVTQLLLKEINKPCPASL